MRALLRSRRHESDDPGLGAISPVAGSPLRARPFPPLSATTENGFRGPTPPTDFCNQSTEQGHTRQTTIPRAELAFSTLSVRPEPFRAEAASGTAPELSLPIWRRLGRRRTGRKTTSQRARSGAEADSTACRAPPVTHSVVASSGLPATLNERAEACFRPAARTGELSADRGAFDRWKHPQER